jgi:hypothetical protein
MNTETTLRTAFLVLALGAFGLACGSDDDGENPPPPTGPSTTQVLRIGNAEGTSGGTAQIELSLESTEPLTGIQFDFNYNPSALTVTDAVTTTRSAGFEVFRADPDAGITRVVLADLSGTAEIATGDGAVVTLTVQIAAAPGTTGIAISDAIAVDRSATPVALGSSEATFTIH